MALSKLEEEWTSVCLQTGGIIKTLYLSNLEEEWNFWVSTKRRKNESLGLPKMQEKSNLFLQTGWLMEPLDLIKVEEE